MLVSNFITIVIYLCAALGLGWSFSKQKNMSHTNKYLIALVSLGGVSHFITLLSYINPSSGMVDLGVFKALSLTSLIMIVIALSFFRQIEILLLSLFFALFTLLLLALSKASQIINLDNQWLLSFHIISAIIAYALIILTMIEAIFLWLRDAFLKQHTKAKWVRYLPPMMLIETWLFKLLSLAFIFLTISLLSGLGFWELWFTKHFIHKTIFSLLAWVFLIFVLVAHHIYGLRGKQAIRWIILVFVLLMLAFVGTKIVQQIIL